MNKHDIVIWNDEYWMYLEDHSTEEGVVLLMRASGDQGWARIEDVSECFRPQMKVPPAVQKSRDEERRKNFAMHITQDFLCYPPLNSEDDPFEPEKTFAQRLRGHIEHCIEVEGDIMEITTII